MKTYGKVEVKFQAFRTTVLNENVNDMPHAPATCVLSNPGKYVVTRNKLAAPIENAVLQCSHFTDRPNLVLYSNNNNNIVLIITMTITTTKHSNINNSTRTFYRSTEYTRIITIVIIIIIMLIHVVLFRNLIILILLLH
jgi:hypothetical protein